MGLHIHSLGELPTSAERSYYVYLLDYGWREPIGKALRLNFARMADAASKSDSVVIRGTRGTHFEDEVLSWHHINGHEASEILPAILITTRHPATIKESHAPPPERASLVSDALLLIPLRKVCKTAEDVADLIEHLFQDIRAKKPLTSFQVVSEMKGGRGRALVDAIILEPAIAGFGINIKDAIKALWGRGK